MNKLPFLKTNVESDTCSLVKVHVSHTETHTETLNIWRSQQGLPGGGSIPTEPWRGVAEGWHLGREHVLKASCCKPWPRCHGHLSCRGDHTGTVLNKHLLLWPGTLAGAYSSVQLWHTWFLALAKDACPPVASCSLSPYQLKMNSMELSCQTMHKLFPCRAKTCGSLQQYFIIYIFD